MSASPVGPASPVRAQVIVLAGPSGSGKSRLAERLGLPVLRLDDFYKDGGDPTLPRIADGANHGIVDWDDPRSWLQDDAVAAVVSICRDGGGDVPVYDIAHDGRTGWQHLDLAGAPYVVAEGIFAQEIVPRLREEGLLAAAYCIRRAPVVTFWLRLGRDLREHRKPPLVLVRRGIVLMHEQRHVVAHAVSLGCRPVKPDEAAAEVAVLVAGRSGPTRPVTVPAGLTQPDQRSCGAACMVVSASLADAAPADPDTFGAAVLSTHRRLTSWRLRGRPQLPWPRALGTPPWALARELSALTGVRHRTRVVRWSRRARPARPSRPARPAGGDQGALVVGNAWLPRHVLLVLADGRCYNPASGRVVALDDPTLTRWRTRWLTVTP